VVIYGYVREGGGASQAWKSWRWWDAADAVTRQRGVVVGLNFIPVALAWCGRLWSCSNFMSCPGEGRNEVGEDVDLSNNFSQQVPGRCTPLKMLPVCTSWCSLEVSSCFLLTIGLYPHFKDLFINYNSYYYGYI